MTRADVKKRLVKKASKLANAAQALRALPDTCTTLDGEKLEVASLWGTHLDDALFNWVFELFKTNMRELYSMSQFGYDESSKRAELQATTARYVIVRTESGRPIAYCHFRFDMDHDSAVIYCYELQVESEYQSKGIGSMLINVLQRIGQGAGMEKMMATVFAFNEKSLGFFHKLGFSADVTCPEPEHNLDYLILSKPCC